MAMRILLLLLGFASGATRAQENIIDIDSTSDAVSVPGACTWRAAFLSAVTNTARDACATGRSDMTDVVRFPVGASIDVSARMVHPSSAESLVIDGRGSLLRSTATAAQCDPTLGGGWGWLHLHSHIVPVAAEGRYEIRDITLQGFCGRGNAGDGYGALTIVGRHHVVLDRVRVFDGTIGGVALSGPFLTEVRDSWFDQVGAVRLLHPQQNRPALGIRSIPPLTDSTHVEIERTTFSGNRCVPVSAQAANDCPPLLLTDVTSARLRNVSFVGNEVPDGAAAFSASLLGQITLQNLTVVGNRPLQGGSAFRIESIGTPDTPLIATIANSVVVGSAEAPSGNCVIDGNVDASYAGTNLSTDATCAGFGQIGDAGLRPLAQTLGQVPALVPTATSVLLDGAIECAPGDLVLVDDARGVARPQDGDGNGTATCDVGAVEFLRNQGPSLSGPSALTALAGTPFVFGSANPGTAISADDPDAFQLPMRVAISTSHGRVKFSGETGLGCDAGTGSPAGDVLRRCTGSLDAIRRALDGLEFLSEVGMTSADIQVTLDDLGNGGDDRLALNDVLAISATLLPGGPILEPDATSLDFGSLDLGEAPAVQSVELRNIGNADFVLASIVLQQDASDYTASNTCGPTLAPISVEPAAVCTITIAFAPTAAGERVGTVLIAGNAANTPLTIMLRGTGQEPSPDDGLIFGDGFED